MGATGRWREIKIGLVHTFFGKIYLYFLKSAKTCMLATKVEHTTERTVVLGAQSDYLSLSWVKKNFIEMLYVGK